MKVSSSSKTSMCSAGAHLALMVGMHKMVCGYFTTPPLLCQQQSNPPSTSFCGEAQTLSQDLLAAWLVAGHHAYLSTYRLKICCSTSLRCAVASKTKDLRPQQQKHCKKGQAAGDLTGRLCKTPEPAHNVNFKSCSSCQGHTQRQLRIEEHWACKVQPCRSWSLRKAHSRSPLCTADSDSGAMVLFVLVRFTSSPTRLRGSPHEVNVL